MLLGPILFCVRLKPSGPLKVIKQFMMDTIVSTIAYLELYFDFFFKYWPFLLLHLDFGMNFLLKFAL